MLEQGASMNPQSNRPYQRRKQYPLGLVLAPVSEFNLKIDKIYNLNVECMTNYSYTLFPSHSFLKLDS